MAFNQQHFSINVDSIGGGGLRIHHYKSSDTLTTIFTPGYVTNAAGIGVRAQEFVVIQADGTVVIAEVFEIDAAGNATLRLMVDGFVRPENFGGVGDGVTDDSAALAAALVEMGEREVPLWLDAGKSYLTTVPLTTDADFVNIIGGGKITTTLLSGNILNIGFGRPLIATKTLAANVVSGYKGITFNNTTDLQEGDVARFVSTKAWYNDPRTAAGLVEADGIGIAQAGGATSITLETGNTLTSALVVGKWLTITDGAGVGQSRLVTAFNEGTEVATVSAWQTNPDNTSIYVFPEATKGETHLISRIISATDVELQGATADGYFVVDTVTEGKAEEAVNIEVHRGYRPILDLALEGPTAGLGSLALLAMSYAVGGEIKVSVKGARSAGVRMTTCYGCKVKVTTESIIDTNTGYGIQVSHCSQTDIDASGWNCRRIVDVSGTTPCDLTRLHSFYISGGGLQEDGSAYYPIGTVPNYGLGTHGPGRNTIYEDGYIDSVNYGIYERGRGSIIRNIRFGPYVERGVYYSFGGTHEFCNNVMDPGAFEDVTAFNTKQQIGSFSGEITDTYATAAVVLGANLLASEPRSQISIHDNTVKVRQHLIESETTGMSTKTINHMKVYDNDVEFFPPTVSDETALFGKLGGDSAAYINLNGERIGTNRLRTAVANTQPLLYGALHIFSIPTQYQMELGSGYHTVYLSDDQVQWFPVPLIGRDSVRMSVIADEDPTTYFDGWVIRNSATLVGDVPVTVTGEATAPTDGTSDGTDTKLCIHFDGGKVTIKNRRGFNRHFDLIFYGFA